MTLDAKPNVFAAPLTDPQGDEIHQIWADVNQVISQLARSAGVDPKVDKNMDIKSVLRCLDDIAKANMAPGKLAWVKTVFNNALQVITTVGGIVSSGASYVRLTRIPRPPGKYRRQKKKKAFPPASTCYCALTSVIQVWKGYEGIFDSLAHLLKDCTDFLNRLEVYRTCRDGFEADKSRLSVLANIHCYLRPHCEATGQ